MRRRIALMLLLLLLTGCTRPGSGPAPAPTQGVPADTPAPATSAPDPSKTGGTQPQSSAAIEEHLPSPATLPDGMRQVELAPGQPVEYVGQYTMEVATGKIKGWASTATSAQVFPSVYFSFFADGRWIKVQGSDTDYLIRRSDGAAFRYDPKALFVLPGPGVLLARPAKPSAGEATNCVFLNEQMKPIATFALKDGFQPDFGAAFSPDGQMLAVSTTQGAEPVALVTVATGTVQGLGAFAPPDGLRLQSVYFSSHPGTGEFQAELQLVAGSDWRPRKTVIRRYSWRGELLSESTFPGWNPRVSPDGRTLFYSQSLGLLGETVVVQQVGSSTPLFRVAGGLAPQWLPNSSEVLLETSQSYQLLSTAGSPKPAPYSNPYGYNPFEWLTPSPDDENLFLKVGSVIDRAGRTLRSVTLPEKSPLRIFRSEWGPNAREVSFTVAVPGGKGYEGELWNDLAPKVQRPPFPDAYPLMVEDPQGECLNLRAAPSKQGNIVRCLPTGTKLGLVQAKDNQRWNEEGSWTAVQTEQGERGWVNLSTHSVGYAN